MRTCELVIAGLALLLLAGCGGNGGDAPDPAGQGLRVVDEGDSGDAVDAPEITLAPATGHPGATVNVVGAGFVETDCAVEIFWESADGTLLARATVEDGAFSAAITIPSPLFLGEYTVVARGLNAPEEPGNGDGGGDEADGAGGQDPSECETPSGEEATAEFTIAVSQPPTGPFDRRIALKTRIVDPPPGVDEDLLDAIRNSESGTTHALVQLHSLPRKFRRELVDGVLKDVATDDVATLAELGIVLLEYLNGVEGIGTAYAASISSEVKTDDARFPELVRAIVALEPGDKVDPRLLASTLPDTLDLLVVLFSDVSRQDGRALLSSLGIAGELRAAPNVWQVTAPAAAVEALAGEDMVEWVEEGPLPFLPLVDAARAAAGVDEVQDLDGATGQYRGLSGRGVQIGIMDAGVDTGHGDFAGRVLRTESPLSNHGTGVAGVAAGSGVQSDRADDDGNPNGGEAFQYRGVAPEAALAAYPHAGGDSRIFRDAVIGLGIDVTNHSYVLDLQGIYSADVASVDRIARGDSPELPARPVVWAAGNNADLEEGRCGSNGSDARPQYPSGCADAYQVGYFSVLSPAKNAICVASLDKETLLHSASSSLGPTFDGRLKPDLAAVGTGLVAPAGSVGDDGSAAVGNGYATVEGSSLAAPVVTGVVSLLLQEYAELTGANLNVEPPLPSTLKAVLVHTATDLEGVDPAANADTGEPLSYGPGPDWATGYGAINAPAAIDLMRQAELLEGELTIDTATAEFIVPVVPGETEVRVTLAWDDVAASVISSDVAAKIVNDLDLVLVAPDGTVHRPQVLPVPVPTDCDNNPENGVQVGLCPGIDASDQDYSGPVMASVDRRNNVEQVLVRDEDGLEPGNWRARVSVINEDGVSLRLPLGAAQKFSLAGVTDQRADVSVVATAEPDPVIAGDSLTYTVTVTNDGPDLAPDVTVRDILPAGLDYVTDTGGCVEDPEGTLTCKLGDLETGEEREFRIRVAVSSDFVALAGSPTIVTNTIEVFSGIPDEDMADNVAVVTTIVEDLADLRVSKTCQPDRNLPAGQTASCTIFVDNLGPSDSRNVRLTDTILASAGYTVTSVVASQGECGEPVDGVIVCHLGDISAASAGNPGRATVTVELTATNTVDISDIATAEADTPDPDLSNNEARESVAVDAVADLALTAEAEPDPVVAGTGLTYTLTATNNGPSEAVDVRVEALLPPSVRVDSVEATGSGACSPGVPGDPDQPTTCVFGSLAPDATETVTIEATVAPSATGVLQAQARITSEVLDTNTGNNLASVTTAVETEADLRVLLTDFPDPVVAGRELVYEVIVSNEGPSTAADVALTHELPDEFRFVSSTVSGGDVTCAIVDVPPQMAKCRIGDLEPGEDVAVYVRVHVELTAEDGKTVTSVVAVTSDTTDPDPDNNTASADTTIIARADLAVTKEDFPDPVTAGNKLAYEIRVTNHGPSTARDVRVMETLPDGVTFLEETVTRDDVTCAAFDMSPQALLCVLDELGSGESFSIFVAVRVHSSVPDGATLESTTTVFTTTVDPDPSNNTATSATSVNRLADLAIDLTSNPDTGNPSVTVVYTLRVSNNGPSDADEVVVTHRLPLSPDTRKVVYVYDNGGCAVDSENVLTCEFGSLRAGEELSFDVHIQVKGSVGLITSTASVRSSTEDPNPRNNVDRRDVLLEGGAARPGK